MAVQKISQFLTKHPRLIALVAGAASSAGFAPLNLWPITLLCFALFMHLVSQAETGKRAALIGWLFGVGHFTIGNNWIAVAFTFQAAMPAWLGWIAVVVLALYLAVYPAICAWGAWWIGRVVNPRHTLVDPQTLRSAELVEARSDRQGALRQAQGYGFSYLLAFAGCWIITEWLRSWVFTGFAWNPLGVVALSTVTTPAEWVGTYGLSGLIIASSGTLSLFLNRQWRSGSIAVSVLALVLLGSVLGSLSNNINLGISNKRSDRPDLTIVQPNISQADK